MMKKLGWRRLGVLCVLILFSFFSTSDFIIPYCNVIKTATYKYGSKGQTVREVQSRLKKWGYYKGGVDGVYGYQTYLGVKAFQRKNGLTVDGVVGNATLKALGINIPKASGGGGGGTKTASAKTATSSSDELLLARLINGEARGEPYEGQVAVGAVILNRTRDPKFPKTIAGVVYQPGAFTAIVDGQVHAQMEQNSIRAARDALNGWDPSSGAIYYFNPDTATSAWIWSRPLIKIIGKHRFCR